MDVDKVALVTASLISRNQVRECGLVWVRSDWRRCGSHGVAFTFQRRFLDI